jgi:hypothetical protein
MFIWKALHEQLLTLENLKVQGLNKYVIFLGECVLQLNKNVFFGSKCEVSTNVWAGKEKLTWIGQLATFLELWVINGTFGQPRG